jgi:ketosteroid isomerase-like protein
MTGDESEALVRRWNEVGPFTPEGLSMVTDDFRWIMPPSMDEAFFGSDDGVRGPAALARIPLVDKAVYSDFVEVEVEQQFTIAEGDRVVMQYDAHFTTHDGEPYRNCYCTVITCREGKIAEVRSHLDTQYFYDKTMGTEIKRAAVFERLAALRAGSED